MRLELAEMLNKISEITIGATTLINVLIVFWIKTLMIKDLFCTKVLFFQLMIEKITKSNQYLKKVKVKKPNLAERRSKKKMKIISLSIVPHKGYLTLKNLKGTATQSSTFVTVVLSWVNPVKWCLYSTKWENSEST